MSIPLFRHRGHRRIHRLQAQPHPRTTWFDSWLEEPEAEGISYCCPEAFQAQKDAIGRLLELSRGDYLVSVSDNAGVLDLWLPFGERTT